MIEVCMFDMGGVVTNFSSAAMEQKLLNDFGKSEFCSFEQLNPLIKDVHHDFLCGLISTDEFWDAFQRITHISLQSTEGLYTKYFMPTKNETTIDLITRLRKTMRVITATNVEPPHRAWHVSHHDYDIFDKAYTSDVMHISKPDPMFYLTIAKEEHKQPEQMFFIDDNAKNIAVAKELGFNTYLFDTTDKLKTHIQTLGLL